MVKPRDRAPVGVEDGWIIVGALMGPHGVRGDVRVKSFTEDPKALFAFADLRAGPDKSPITLSVKAKLKDGFIAVSPTVTSREAAAALKGASLYVARTALETTDDEDDFYLVDLIGLEARSAADGSVVGRVRAVENFGAEDLLELVLTAPARRFGRYIFVPFRKALVPVVDPDGGFVSVDLAAWWALQEGGDAVEDGTAAEGYSADD